MQISISSGHGFQVPGAVGIIDEVTEARRVSGRVFSDLRDMGVPVALFHENVHRNARDNINSIIAWHNSQRGLLDVSVHFNSVGGGIRPGGIGTETLYRTGNAPMGALASNISKGIVAATGLILRRGDGTWARDNLGFLTRTNSGRAVLLEICFVNSEEDVRLYRWAWSTLCRMIALELRTWYESNA